MSRDQPNMSKAQPDMSERGLGVVYTDWKLERKNGEGEETRIIKWTVK